MHFTDEDMTDLFAVADELTLHADMLRSAVYVHQHPELFANPDVLYEAFLLQVPEQIRAAHNRLTSRISSIQENPIEIPIPTGDNP